MKRLQPIHSYEEFETYDLLVRERHEQAIAAMERHERERFVRRIRRIGDFIRGRNLSHSQHIARLGLAILFWAIVIPLLVILAMSL